LYGFYLACYEAILHSIRPGVTASVCMQDAVKKMDGILASSRFSKETHSQAAKAFVDEYRKSAERADATLGHWVGMATHDDGPHEGPLRPGMVFTIEPALRVPEEKIYVRLEDVIVITEKGIDVLSDFVPRDIARIEKLMTENGLLKSYPRED
ncbi:MAG: M24 family metallopeptidase, partial [Acidobacteriota bacterium]